MSRRGAAAAPAQGGFTLVEVIVAMAIFAVLLGVIYGALGGVTRAYDAAEAAVKTGSRERVGTDFITRLLERAYPLALADGREWVAHFRGETERVGFVADLPGYVGQAGMHEVWLQVREDDGESALWFLWRPMMVDADSGEVDGEFQERVLIRGIDGLRLRYFGSGGEEQEPDWQDEWIGQQRIPALVEVRLTDGAEEAWPVLRVRPRGNALRYLSVRRGGAGGAGPDAGTAPPDAEPAAGGALPSGGGAASNVLENVLREVVRQ